MKVNKHAYSEPKSGPYGNAYGKVESCTDGLRKSRCTRCTKIKQKTEFCAALRGDSLPQVIVATEVLYTMACVRQASRSDRGPISPTHPSFGIREDDT